MERASEFRRLRAPQEDGQKLIDPPWSALSEVVADNRQRLAQVDVDIQGRSAADLAATARHALIHQAANYTSLYRDVADRLRNPSAGAPLVLSGHQPQLFHAGVWYKNFVLGGLSRRLGGVGIHLLIDSDLCRSASIRVPTGPRERPRAQAVPYDEPAAEVPYEERQIRDEATLASFDKRVTAVIQPLVPEPLVRSLWPLVTQRNRAQTNLGLRLAQARHALEQTWSNHTLELPQSAVCQLPEFAWFVCHVLAHLPRFWTAHNDSLAAYRAAHRLRNRAQPVPDLTESDGWLEAPFWIWSASDPRRRPLFARQSADELQITDREAFRIALPLSADRGAAAAVEKLLELPARRIKIRTRALATTLFARLVLSDMFLHGIGGAKYDQVTDEIARQFFGFELPQFATVSATLRLPISHERMDALQESKLRQQAREMRYHPERYVTVNGPLPPEDARAVAQLIKAKLHWIRTPKTRDNARERHVAIAGANQALQPYLTKIRDHVERRREELAERKRAGGILASREYSFCLHPREHFEQLLLDDPPLVP
ncbi:MAG TPA: hypothetical protein VGK58_05865 [Lacipirellulaceae bacterium]